MTDFHDFGEADYAGKPLEMIITRANLKIQSGLQYAQSMNRPVYFIGPAGVGKTVALREAVNQIECAYYCSTTEATKGYSGMLSMIHVAMRRTLPNEKSNFLLAERVKQLLKHGNTWSETLGDWQPVKKLLIIDEVQTMETRLVFELLKMQEDCRFNLILCGNGQSLAARKKDRETIKADHDENPSNRHTRPVRGRHSPNCRFVWSDRTGRLRGLCRVRALP